MLGSHCFSSPPEHSTACGAGTVKEVGGLQAYFTGPPESNRAILIIPDAFGFEAPNLRKLADKVADTGFLVVVPDFFFGDPVISLEKPGFDGAAWQHAHTPAKGAEDAKAVIAALKNNGVSAIGAAGFCWGGMAVIRLARNFDYIQAAVVLHPGPISKDDINEIRVPTALLGAEVDQYFSAEDLKQLGAMLAKKSQIDSFLKIYPGTSHGWTTRYNAEDESAVKIAEEAHLDMLNWLTKYVK